MLLEVKSLNVQIDYPGEGRKRKWFMSLTGVGNGIPGWNIDWCEEAAARVTVEDSTGRKAPKVQCESWIFGQEENRVFLSPLNWLPSIGSQWVAVKGEIPFVVSRREAVTVPAELKLVKGASIPLVLKEAAMGRDGLPADVNAALVVTEYRDVSFTEDREGGDKKVLELEVRTDAPVSIRDIELSAMDGGPVIEREWGYGRWSRSWKIKKVKEGKLLVSVRYSQGLRKSRAVIDGKASLAGFSMGKNGRAADKGFQGAGASSPVCARANGKAEGRVRTELTGLEIWNESRKEDQDDPVRMLFHVELTIKEPAVFGSFANAGEQTLEVVDSTGRILPPAVFELTWLNGMPWKDGEVFLQLRGKEASFASPGAEWLRLKGTLRVPVATMQESPVYELPLVKGAELPIPVPGAASSDGDGIDISVAGDVPTCRLNITDLKDENGTGKSMNISLHVVGTPFELDCFELVDEEGIPLKNARSSARGGSFDSAEKERFWEQTFTIEDAADLKQVRIRLKYKINAETVNVPVDFRIGLGGPVSRKVDEKRP